MLECLAIRAEMEYKMSPGQMEPATFEGVLHPVFEVRSSPALPNPCEYSYLEHSTGGDP